LLTTRSRTFVLAHCPFPCDKPRRGAGLR
jgi:hypothetical protein